MNAFLCFAAAVLGTFIGYGLIASPWWLRVALVAVCLWLAILCLVAYVSAPPLTGGERVDNK